ncbi:MAG: hypothetical protein V9E87_16800 [Gemmatimonadales bacterium]
MPIPLPTEAVMDTETTPDSYWLNVIDGSSMLHASSIPDVVHSRL